MECIKDVISFSWDLYNTLQKCLYVRLFLLFYYKDENDDDIEKRPLPSAHENIKMYVTWLVFHYGDNNSDAKRDKKD